ncbi:lipase 3-like [Daktulosphaira vitifoliae]|uniref:lipase 3-like n=1 Tax=Daktulosphaira vitifoliae TaxID=58002 RepID=UPI0021A9AAD8|nr:lipase 3-like [Daktulosphaira vitifoliae]
MRVIMFDNSLSSRFLQSSLFLWMLSAGISFADRSTSSFVDARRQLWRSIEAASMTGGDRTQMGHRSRQWRAKAKPGRFVNDHMLARRQWNYLSSTKSPSIVGHWKELAKKLELNTMWPGTGRFANESFLLNTTEDFVRQEGYPVERHTVITSDGYNLTLHRIPYSKFQDPTIKRPVIIVQHGILCSSTDWVISGRNGSLGFILSDAGYDVWLTNTRGNSYSRNHLTLNPAQEPEKFWDFSWHEMGTIDLPNMIDYILEVTGEPDVGYVGHSMGTTMFYVMCSEKPEYAKKVRSMASLAPIAFLNHVKSPIMAFLASVADPLAWLCGVLGYYEFRPNGKLMLFAGKSFCESSFAPRGICDNLLFLFAGYDSKRLTNNVLPVILAHTPAGASARQLTHYAQLMKRDRWFGMYNYNKQKNLDIYGQVEPLAYDLNKVTMPVALYYASNDWMSTVEDVDVLANLLPNLKEKRLMPYPEFNHLDFLWATGIKMIVYDDLIRFMKIHDRKYLHVIENSEEIDKNVVSNESNKFEFE